MLILVEIFGPYVFLPGKFKCHTINIDFYNVQYIINIFYYYFLFKKFVKQILYQNNVVSGVLKRCTLTESIQLQLCSKKELEPTLRFQDLHP